VAERRAIRSDIWDDEDFGMNTLLAELVWIGLFSKCADDQGRLIDNLPLIGKNIFPYKDIPVAEIEACLQSYGEHVIRYEVDGKRYIQLATWWDHQPLKYAVPSKYPAPEGWQDRYKTYYKGTNIIFNWVGIENTEAGEKLASLLKSLHRQSTWTDYVGTLNTNTNLNPNPNQINSDSGEKAAQKKVNPKKARGVPEKKPNLFQIAHALADVTGLDYEKNNGHLYKVAAKFKQGEEQQIIREYGLGGLWYQADWRGLKHQKPTPELVVETWNNLGGVQPQPVSIPKRSINGREEVLPPGYTSFAQLDAARAEVAKQMSQKVAV
jgi:hypothetical protein